MSTNSWQPCATPSPGGTGSSITTATIPLATQRALPANVNVHAGITVITIPPSYYPKVGAVYSVQAWCAITGIIWSLSPTAFPSVALGVAYGPYYGDTSNISNLMNCCIGSYSVQDPSPDATASLPYQQATIAGSFVATTTNNGTTASNLRLMFFNLDNGGQVGTNTQYQLYNLTVTEVAAAPTATITSSNLVFS
jgi:hypothetical protein